MKKLTAMLLALCMLLAAVPALCDEDVTGFWAMVLADVNLGYFDLKEDGTVTGEAPGQGEVTGTWTQEGNTVTITIDGDPAEFIYDGTTLVSDTLPVPLVREEGRLSFDVALKMINGEDVELPEGMTQEDITAILQNFLVEYQKLTGAEDDAA